MPDDILAQVREEILKEDQSSLPWVPKRLDQTWETQAGIAGAIAGLFAGATLGAHMGLAGPWGAIAGTVPCAIIGAAMGYFAGAKAGSAFKRQLPYSSGNRALTSGSDSHAKALGQGTCAYCGAPKSSWWDSTAGHCGKCNRS